MRLIALFATLFLLSISLTTQSPIIALQFGDNLPPGVQSGILLLFNTSTFQYPMQQFDASEDLTSSLDSGSFLFSFGKTVTTQKLLNYTQLDAAGFETMAVYNDVSGGVIRIVGDGNPVNENATYSLGAGFAAYRGLELVGFGFLHPLQPAVPPQLQEPTQANQTLQFETPRWSFRGTHYHTEHPLELTEFLQGMGVNASMLATDPSWASMIPEGQLLAQWLVATRQNRIEWLLLCANDWYSFCDSDLRRERLVAIVDIFHSYGILAAADLPIIERQQNAWYMIETLGKLGDEYNQMKNRIDFIVGIGFDFISTESGFSEFTHPNDTLMLNWMQYAADYSLSQGVPLYIKCHCSSGQTCPDYKDPRTGQPLNFNFLPMMANKSLGVYGHTVQMYSFTDPAPTYGNTNFTYMLDFMMYESADRPTVYHGETAYWVNYDIDVPLFLPLYPDARLRDLRMIAERENATHKVLGQMNFCSGFEWAYWLSEVLTQKASWNPYMDLSLDDARVQLLTEVLSIFGPATGEIVQLIGDIVSAEHQLLVLGQVTGVGAPQSVVKRNGIAYLEGWDTWSTLGDMTSGTGDTQPDRYSPLDVRFTLSGTEYGEIYPLLQEMATNFTSLAARFDTIRALVPEYTLPLFNDMADSMQMTALRAVQVNGLYSYSSTWDSIKETERLARNNMLAVAKDALTQAAAVVQEREQHYRVPVERIASWRPNPTSYAFTYLWTVHSQFYMWRDHDLATLAHPEILSPCYMNIINAIETIFGEGRLLEATDILYDVLETNPVTKFIGDCLNAPKKEPHYPLKSDL